MRSCLSLLLCLALATAARGQNSDKAFGVVGRGLNQHPAFMVRLGVNRKDHTYVEGENLVVTVESERSGYLYLYYIQVVDGKEQVFLLYPNEFAAGTAIKAKTEITIPSEKDSWDLKTIAPFGTGRLFALVGNTESLKAAKTLVPKEGPPLVPTDEVLKILREAQQRKPQDFAEVFLDLTTLAAGDVGQRERNNKPRRVAVCIGISDYADQTINDLTVSHHDAEVMADLLKKQCKVDEVLLLTNKDATRSAIEAAIFQDLPAKTKPGDTVFIFYSGHGGRCADTNGDEADGFDEYLVPQDGKQGKDDTMILDDVFGRWIQQLEGRKVCIVLDNCHSGGSSKGFGDAMGKKAKGRKGIAAPLVDKQVDKLSRVDFFDGEVKRAKDLGQKDTAIIAACQANQLAWEMLPPSQESVLTHYLVQAAGKANGRLEIGAAFRLIEEDIKKYVKENISAEQTPLLIDNAGGTILLIP
ncbi:MAG: caspase family protein [Pirellulaceae bacterium]